MSVEKLQFVEGCQYSQFTVFSDAKNLAYPATELVEKSEKSKDVAHRDKSLEIELTFNLKLTYTKTGLDSILSLR